MARTRPGLINKAELRSIRRIDDRLAFAAIAFNYVIVIATAGMASWINRIPVTLFALVIIAGRQSALQGLVHSASHYSLFAKRRNNIRFQFLFAFPIVDSVPLYRDQHLEHHRDFALKTPDRFEYLYDSLQLSKEGICSRTWVVFIRPLLGHAGVVFVTDAIKTLSGNLRQAFGILAYWTLLIAVMWWLGCFWIFVIFWVVPLVWLYPVLDIWAELSDHLDAQGESRNQKGAFYCIFFKGHEMYHAVHHLYPFVPFHRLGRLHDKLQQRGMVMESSRGPRDFLRIVYRGRALTKIGEPATRMLP
jgi:fatty acid desaturase